MTDKTGRRGFIRLCGKTAVGLAAAQASAKLAAVPSFALDNPPRTALVDQQGKALTADRLKVHENWIFHYPLNSTPALLIRLDEATARDVQVEGEDGKTYKWPGGAGPDGTIVAYAAICAHALSYDSRNASFLNYRKVRNQMTGHGRVITCCAHASVYDPAAGAKVLAGPAKFPLAAILLQHQPATGALYALGVTGTELYGKFIKAYRKDLRKEFGRAKYKKPVGGETLAMPMRDYTEDMIEC